MRKTLWIGAALLAFPACRTEEIATPVTIARGEPGPDRGELAILFAPTIDTFEEQQAWVAAHFDQYSVLVDGGQLTLESDGGRLAIVVYEGSGTSRAFVAAGPHHFSIAAAGGGPTIFAGDAEIPPGSTTRLYLFGHRAALQGRFVSYPAVPAAGTLHVSAINLFRLGPGIEVVSCVDAASCAPLSPPLAFGESFDADFAAGTSDETRFLLATGASIGYRQLATAALPAPPAQPLSSMYVPWGHVESVPANLAVAPIYMSAQGNVIMSF